MIPVIVIRPQPGCDASLDEARKLGLDAHGFPLFEVKPIAWEPPDPARIDALLIGSANALRHGGAALSAFRGKPVYAVGEATAEAARAAGLDVAATGAGGLQDVLDRVQARHRRLLRLTGETRVSLQAPEGTMIEERVVYASKPLPMPPALADKLRHPAVILLHSAEAARHFAGQCNAHGIDRAILSLVVIGPRVAEAAGSGWANVAVAETPGDNALLALAFQICEGQICGGQIYGAPRGSKEVGIEPIGMQDEIPTPVPVPAPQAKTARTTLLVALVAFLLGAGLAGWLVWRGDLLPAKPNEQADRAPAAQQAGAQNAAPALAQGDTARMSQLGSVETRLALLEDRLSRVDLQANAASGNAARAEGLLLAFAARRLTDKGKPLGYLEDQLKLRFADAQPVAVDTIIAYARKPMTLENLCSRLDMLAPDLAEGPTGENGWQRIRRELSALFMVHRESAPARTPQARIARARLMLDAGRTEDAIAEVRRLPGAEAAQTWIADAQRYAAVQRALDLIETAAMLEPRRLKDAEGKTVSQPSPLAQPADKAAEAAPPAGT